MEQDLQRGCFSGKTQRGVEQGRKGREGSISGKFSSPRLFFCHKVLSSSNRNSPLKLSFVLKYRKSLLNGFFFNEKRKHSSLNAISHLTAYPASHSYPRKSALHGRLPAKSSHLPDSQCLTLKTSRPPGVLPTYVYVTQVFLDKEKKS